MHIIIITSDWETTSVNTVKPAEVQRDLGLYLWDLIYDDNICMDIFGCFVISWFDCKTIKTW